MSTKEKYLVQVWQERGGCLPNLTSIEEVGECILSDSGTTPDITALKAAVGTYLGEDDISTDLAGTKAAVGTWSAPDDKSMAEVLEDEDDGIIARTASLEAEEIKRVASKATTETEAWTNKVINAPLINEGVRAYIDIPLAATDGTLRVSAVDTGTAGNLYTVVCTHGVATTGIGISWATPNLNITLPTESTETAYSLVRYISFNNPEIFKELAFSYTDEDADKLVEDLELNYLAHGTDGTAMTSTGTQIDAVVAQYHKDKYDATIAPDATNDETEEYGVGSRWYDTVAKEWYICTDATEDNATWDIMTLSEADLGTAALADIVDDLTTGGTTDVLSAEQGKALDSRLQTAESDIDDLQGDVNDLEAVVQTEATPVMAAYASATLTSDETAVTNDSEVVIDDVTYTFKTALTAETCASYTYDTDKITFTANDAGVLGNNIQVKVTCELEATLGSDTTEITLQGRPDRHPNSDDKLVSAQITQAATEAALTFTNTDGVIVIALPADASNNPITITMATLVAAIEADVASQEGVLHPILYEVTEGASYSGTANAATTSAINFSSVEADNTKSEAGSIVTIYLAHNGTTFENWADVVTDLGTMTLATVSDGAASAATTFTLQNLTGGQDTIPNEVLIGADSDASLTNLALAVNGGAGEGTNYSDDTTQPSDITADVNTTDNTVVFTVGTIGTGGNAYMVSTDDAHLTFGVDVTTFAGGLAGTVGAKGELVFDGTNVYISPVESTATSSNWRKIAHALPAVVTINNSDATAAYVLTAVSQTVVITDNNEENIELPEATGSGIEIRIANKCGDAHDVVVSDGSGDVIDADGSLSLAQYTSCVLIDVADGIWAQF